MDPDEVCVLCGSVAITLIFGARWAVGLLRTRSPNARWVPGIRLLLGVWPLALLFFLALALFLGAAREVREDTDYVVLFVALGAAWLVGTVLGLELIGVSARDDAIERNNLAAAVAVAGALTGGLIVYGFANMGEGDTIWTTIGPAALASMTGFVLWTVHQATSGAADAITIDRDLASGVRFAGMAIGTGLILGRAVAGDYESAASTVRDLVWRGWPATALVALAVVLQRRLTPNQRSTTEFSAFIAASLLPACGYVALGVLNLMILGSWVVKSAP